MSDPALLPSAYVQRTTVTLNRHGISPTPNSPEPLSVFTGLDPAAGRDFIINKPFLFGLFDAETSTCLMAAIYSQPTFKY